MKKISILIPAYNEESNLQELKKHLDRLTQFTPPPSFQTTDVEGVIPEADLPDMTKFEWEFVFVNDGSKDNTLAKLYELREYDSRVVVINLSRNFGKENAMLAGMDNVTGDAVIIMDADLQHPVEAIPEMIYWWEQGYDDVYGLRRQRGKESWIRKKLSLTFYSLLQGTTRIEILQNVGDFRLLDRRVVNAICELRESQRYTKGLYCWVGYKKKGVYFTQVDRFGGKSSFNLKGLINLAVEGITCFTTSPLRISTILGFLVSIIALIYILIILVKTIFWGESVQGFPTLMCTILFLGGIQLIALGIIGEYLGRIFNETKQRPPYIIESINGEKLNGNNR